jgi:pimeloyl-ACP methyl ester carboxylesterase
MRLADRLREAAGIALTVPELADDARRCKARIELIVREQSEAVVLWHGQANGPLIRLVADGAAWAQTFSSAPAPGYQSLGALRRKIEGVAVEADELALAQALPFIERLLQRMREAAVDGKCSPDPAPDRAVLGHLHGRYVELGVTQAGSDWVYAETCGPAEAPALLMLHTAGADARQWHGVMGIESIRSQWQMHAFDLPGHGRSPLPAGTANWHWRLTQADYLRWVIQYMDAVGLERAVLIGCSMGAAIGLPLLAQHPERFAGAILLEVPYRSPGRRSPYLNSPDVHGGRLAAAWVGSLLSPTTPREGHNDATWVYSQSAPGVYDGDLAFYSDDFDAHAHTAGIDAGRTPLWLLTGDYDYSATPADSRSVAREIPGAQFVEMQGMGHFPMVEDPKALSRYLAQPLQQLRDHAMRQGGSKKTSRRRRQ